MRRKPVEALRVPLNCLISPGTKERLTGIQNETRESQGEIIDRALDVLLAITPETEPKPARKTNRRDREVQQRAASDVTAQRAGRKGIDYSDLDSTPTTSVATLDAVGPTVASRQGKASVEHWRAGRKPLPKRKERK